MSKFAEKIFRGEKPTDNDWNEHLKEAHKIAPSMTPLSFAPYKTCQGLNSYEILAQALNYIPNRNLSILDLACGDGHLTSYLLPKIGKEGQVLGVDMSMGELEVAINTQLDPRAKFIQATAQSLPIENSSIDAVLSHMAFMLMLPVEPVVQELYRVLKPNGYFSAIVGGEMKTAGIYSEMLNQVFEFIDKRYPIIKSTKSGDSRVRDKNGVIELFSHGFRFIEESFFSLQVNTNPQGSWDFIKDMYFIALLPQQEKTALKKIFINFSKSKCDPMGNIEFQFPMRQFTMQKIG